MINASSMCINQTEVDWKNCSQVITNNGLNNTATASGTVETVMASVTLGIINVLSILGNIMVLYVIAKHLQFKTVTNAFIATLSVSDLLSALICMPMSLVTVIRKEWLFGDTGCMVNEVIISTFSIISTVMLAFITADRYFVVVKLPKRPLALKCALFAIAGACCLSLLFSSPWYLLSIPKGSGNCSTYPCDQEFHKRGYQHCMYIFHIAHSRYRGAAFGVIHICVCYVLPTVVMMFSSFCLWKIIHNNKCQTRPSCTPVTQLRFEGEMRTAKTVVIMVVLYLITRWPYLIAALIAAMRGKSPSGALDTAVMWLFWTNCALNPVVYAMRNPTVAKMLHLGRKSGYEDTSVILPAAVINTDNMPQISHSEWTTPRRTNYLSGSVDYGNGKGDRSDSIPSVLLFKANTARKGSSFSTMTTSTNITTNM